MIKFSVTLLLKLWTKTSRSENVFQLFNTILWPLKTVNVNLPHRQRSHSMSRANERCCCIYKIGRLLDKGVLDEHCLATPIDRQGQFRWSLTLRSLDYYFSYPLAVVSLRHRSHLVVGYSFLTLFNSLLWPPWTVIVGSRLVKVLSYSANVPTHVFTVRALACLVTYAYCTSG